MLRTGWCPSRQVGGASGQLRTTVQGGWRGPGENFCLGPNQGPCSPEGSRGTDTEELVRGAQQGDREAFGQLYEQFSTRIYSYLYCHLNGRVHLAEDLSEEVFVKVLEKLDSYDDRGLPFAAWIFRIAHNHLIDYRRAQARARVLSIEECPDIPEHQAERVFDLTLTQAELVPAMAQLSDDQRRVVALRFLQGMSVSETSCVLGKTPDAVKQLQARGLHVLRRVLGSQRHSLAVA